jgi:dipeptidyl aminopeptidase/acylaminoacyl peptidase
MKKIVGLISLLFSIELFFAQNGSEIYIADIEINSNYAIVSNIKNISNNAGYDNQPHFLKGTNKILFASNRDGKQTDIYEYDINSEKITPFITSEESEYSPTLSADGKSILCVRVEKDETQRLWSFDLKKRNPKVFLPKVDSVGYFTFLSNQQLAIFVLGEPQTLRLVNTKSQIENIIDSSIGRSLHAYPINNQLYYVDKKNESKWYLKTLKDNKIVEVIEMPNETEDFCITSEGLILTFSKNKLLGFYPGESRSWFVLAELNDFANKKITRLAINTNSTKLAFVVNE